MKHAEYVIRTVATRTFIQLIFSLRESDDNFYLPKIDAYWTSAWRALLKSHPQKLATSRFGNAFQLRRWRFISFADFAQGGEKGGGSPDTRRGSSSRTGSLQVAKLSASDIRPVRAFTFYRPREGEAREGGGWLRGTESVSRRVSRGPTAVAGIARSHSHHQCPPSPVARRRPPSAASHPHASPSQLSRVAFPSRRDTRVSFLEILAPRAPYTAHTTPARGSITREEAPTSPRGYVAPVPGKSVGSSRFLFLRIPEIAPRARRDFSDQRFCGPTDPL